MKKIILVILLFSPLILISCKDKTKQVEVEQVEVEQIEVEQVEVEQVEVEQVEAQQVETEKLPIVSGLLNANHKLVGKFDDLNSFLDLYTEDELSQITGILLIGNGLTSMSGIERMPNLKYIVLNRNSITKIEGLSKLKFLEEVEITRNSLKDISDLENVYNLKALNIRGEKNAYDEEYMRISRVVGENNPEARYLEF